MTENQTRQRQRYEAETALIQALALYRDGKSELALEMAIVAVGRIGATIPKQLVEKVAHTVADRMILARSNG